jgi:ABC-2 type transport system ATP-binding protein
MMDDKTIRIYAPEMSPVELSRALILNEVGLEALNKKQISLEEHFLKLIQGADDNA